MAPLDRFYCIYRSFFGLQVYENLGKFYEQNQAAAVGDVLSQIESVVEGECSLERDGDVIEKKQL